MIVEDTYFYDRLDGYQKIDISLYLTNMGNHVVLGKIELNTKQNCEKNKNQLCLLFVYFLFYVFCSAAAAAVKSEQMQTQDTKAHELKKNIEKPSMPFE